MLFNSYAFIFLFLPTVLLGFHWIGKQGHHRIAIAWLVGASLFFYGWWNPAYLGLILVSILFNYAVGVSLGGAPKHPHKKPILILGVAANLGMLGYFKYANFFVDNLNNIAGTDIERKNYVNKGLTYLAMQACKKQGAKYFITGHGSTDGNMATVTKYHRSISTNEVSCGMFRSPISFKARLYSCLLLFKRKNHAE